MNNELKPCPFCGSEDLDKVTCISENVSNYYFNDNAIFGQVWIKCGCCKIEGRKYRFYHHEDDAEAYEKAKQAWNNRAYEE